MNMGRYMLEKSDIFDVQDKRKIDNKKARMKLTLSII